MIVRCLFDKMVSVEELKKLVHPKNRNHHPASQIAQLAKILNYQGWRYPIKISKQSGFITSGHGRLEAAMFNSWGECPVNYQDYETPDQEYLDLQADNAIALQAELDLDGIRMDVTELGPIDTDLLGMEEFKVSEKLPDAIKNTNTELDIDSFDNFQHTCPKCNFGWNDV